MTTILSICLALAVVLRGVLTADVAQVPTCKRKYGLTLSGVRNADGDWNTTFGLEKWNATSNWTLIVQHKTIEDEGKAATYMRGYLADGEVNVTVDGMRRLWTCENGNSNIENSPKMVHNFGAIPYPTWNITDVEYGKTLQYWQTSSDCTTTSGCRSKLTEIYKEQMKTDGHLLDNFHVLPDGTILEGIGWNKIYGNRLRINIFSKAKDVFPSNLALEAFAYFAQAAASLGKVRKEFSIYVPPHTSGSVDSEVRRWISNYKLSFDDDFSLSRRSIDEDLQIISRSEWKAIRPMRELEKAKGEADIVEVKITASTCLTHSDCAQFVRNMQIKEMPLHSDIYSNFIFGRDGRIYEGIGWNWTRKDKVVYFEILADSGGSSPWSHQLAAFTLMLREGVDFGWISETYTINVASTASQTASAKITKWGEWARHIVRENITVNLQTAGGDDSIITRIDTGVVVRQRNVVPQAYPVGTILFTQRNAACSKRMDCLPFYKSLGRKSLRSLNEVKSNFYFVDDEEPYGILQEGLGWDLTSKVDEVVFEFLTPNTNTLPSNRSMMASTFLIREGLNKGILRPDYHLTVGKHTSIQFENLVRFWDKRIREV